METLLLWNPRTHLRHRLKRPHTYRGGKDGTHEDHPGQGNEGRPVAGIREQAGLERSNAAQGGLRPATIRQDRQRPRMEGRAQLRDNGRGHLRGTGMALKQRQAATGRQINALAHILSSSSPIPVRLHALHYLLCLFLHIPGFSLLNVTLLPPCNLLIRRCYCNRPSVLALHVHSQCTIVDLELLWLSVVIKAICYAELDICGSFA